MPNRLLFTSLLVFAALAAPASAFTVGAGELRWTNVNVYAGGGCANNCTFAGFTADARNTPGAANGTVTPEAPATGPAVTTATLQNTTVTHAFPAKPAGGAYDPATNSGTLEYDGLLRFKSTKFGFDLAVNDPQIVLSGTTGKLYASGTRYDNQPYDRSTAVFDLDLSNATYSEAGGSATISGIVPKVAQAGYVFFPNYATGAGPERDPDTFGSFSLTALAPAPAITVTPRADLPSSGQTVTVTGTGASRTTQGLYVFLARADAAATDQTAAPSGTSLSAFSFVRQDQIAADGSFSTTISARSPFLTGGGTVDCVLVPCGVRTIAAHYADDRSQDTFTPVTFRQVYTIPTPTPTVSATPTPDYDTPTPGRSKLSKIALTRSKVRFTLSRAARVTGSVRRKGKVDGKKVRRTVRLAGAKGRNAKKLSKLPKGSYTVRLKPAGGAAKTKRLRLR